MDQAEELIPIIAIIGGADGPTSIYVVGRDNFWVLVIFTIGYPLFKIGQIRKQMNEQLELYMQSSE